MILALFFGASIVLRAQDVPDDSVRTIMSLQDAEKDIDPARFAIPIDTLIRRLEERIARTAYVEGEAQGFRVQILAANTFSDAAAKKSLIRSQFPTDSVYVVYDQPIYKIRLGDFRSREDAESKLRDVIDGGYRGAWVVPDRILVYRKAR